MENELSESGFTMVSNDVFELIPKLGTSAFTVYTVIFRGSVGFQKMNVVRSLRTIAKKTGLSVNTVQAALKKLEKFGLIQVIRNGKETLSFFVKGLRKSIKRGFQFSKQFMKELGMEMKAKKTIREADEVVSAVDKICVNLSHKAMSAGDAYKERKKNLNIMELKNLHQKAKETSKQAYELMQKVGRSGYQQACSFGGDTFRKLYKAYGWSRLVDSNPSFSYVILRELEGLAMEILQTA